MNDGMVIYAFVGTREHGDDMINPGNSVLIRAKDEQEQEKLMREVALAVAGDVVRLCNGLYMMVTSIR